MGEAFITRRGGEAVERTTAPSINFVSKTTSEIVVTFTNNDAAEAEVFFGITSTLTDTVTLAAAATSSNITFSGLDDDTAFTVSAFALVTDPTSKKIKSEVVTTVITTDAAVFTAATGGTTLEYDSGGKRFRSHTFTSNGNFVVSTVGDNVDDRNKVDYLIIAGGASGGGSGGGSIASGGGGAGGFRTTVGTQGGLGTLDSKVVLTAQTFSISVGAGGAARTSALQGESGTNSSGLGVTSTGGGGGGVGNSASLLLGLDGGSGGGGGSSSAAGAAGGNGTTNQGFAGGTGAHNPGVTIAGAGGGGAGAVGGNASGNTPGTGGVGVANTLRNNTSETRAAGGAGNSTASGAANTGTGGGGAITGNSAAGGSGIVVIRYEIAPTV